MFIQSFNPLERGNSNQIINKTTVKTAATNRFQSPRTGKFESNVENMEMLGSPQNRFNPLERGNSNQIHQSLSP